jgi:hypothetical protein
MSGTKDNSKTQSVEEVISLDDIDDDPNVIIIEKTEKGKKVPVYFECSDEFEAFEGDYVDDKESSNS